MIKKTLLLLCLLTCIPAFAGMADVYADSSDQTIDGFLIPKVVAKHQKTIDRVAGYLTGLTTIVSDFSQVAPDGSLTSGKFYLQRPGKMRWQYNPPTPILMVSDGTILTYYDYELKQVSNIPLDSTLISFLGNDKIRFDDKVGIVDFSEKSGVIRITVAQREKPTEGQLTLEFSDNPLQIRNMVVTDATHQVTTVSLNNAQFGTQLDPKLFVFTEPRQARRRLH